MTGFVHYADRVQRRWTYLTLGQIARDGGAGESATDDARERSAVVLGRAIRAMGGRSLTLAAAPAGSPAGARRVDELASRHPRSVRLALVAADGPSHRRESAPAWVVAGLSLLGARRLREQLGMPVLYCGPESGDALHVLTASSDVEVGRLEDLTIDDVLSALRQAFGVRVVLESALDDA